LFVHLFPNELAMNARIRDEVDLGIELPVVCELANEFLAALPPSGEDAEICDQALAALLRHTSASLRSEVSERLAHVEDGPRRTVRLLAYDAAPAVAVPVLRYSPLVSDDEVTAIARLDPGAAAPKSTWPRSRRGASSRPASPTS
jgi:hypothetical protein